MSDIIINKARMHNLKGIDVTIPRNSLTVITGLSGSGKSSLAFDTLYAEGQRRYVESLSAYARQFLDRLAKPDVEKIEGLSPAISIEQHTTSGNPRSIVATVTEIHDYLRILYGSVAEPHCPKCGKRVTKQSAEQIVESILNFSIRRFFDSSIGECSHNVTALSSAPYRAAKVGGEGTAETVRPTSANTIANRRIDESKNRKIILLAPVVKGKKGRHEEVFATLKRNGFARVRVDGEIHLIEEVPELDKKKSHNIDVVIDRLVLPPVTSLSPSAPPTSQAAPTTLPSAPPTSQAVVGVRRSNAEPEEPKMALGVRRSNAEPEEPQATEAERAALRTRLTDSVELALKTGQGVIKVQWLDVPSKNFSICDSPTDVTALSSAPYCAAKVGGEGTVEAVRPTSAITINKSKNRKIDKSKNLQPACFEQTFSELNACLDCGISFDELKPRSFSFNSPFGACPTCSGLGQLYYFDEDLVVPDKTLPLRECIHPWRRAGHNAIMYYNALLEQIAKQYKVKLSTPWEKLPAKFRHDLMHGFKDDLILPWRSVDRPFEGVLATLQKRLDEAEDDETRAKWEAYQSYRTCPTCHGARLNEFSRAATIAGKSIVDVMAMPVGEAKRWFDSSIRRFVDSSIGECSQNVTALHRCSHFALQSSRCSADTSAPYESTNRRIEKSKNAKWSGLRDILLEITRRLQFLLDVGLDYLTLDRASATLSGGEMQRIRLATQIGSGLTGVLYVLDEPTIGLHPRDNERLIATLKELRDRGNTVVIVEHDEEMMRAADWIVDLGPGAGREGGELMYQGDFKGLLKANSLTAQYLRGEKGIGVGDRCSGRGNTNVHLHLKSTPTPTLTLAGACEHNLKNITVHIPVGSFTVVTGVSGSGKSTLIDETLKRALMKHFYHAKATPGKYKKLTGMEHFDKVIEIDQSPIGRTPRSNPATYVGFFSEIRELFAKTEAAKARGYHPGRFSFNMKGGRCEVCGGDGVQKLEMSFLPDVYVTCEQCGGRRFNAETLEVTYNGKNIADVLDMTVAEAYEFFAKVPSLARKMKTLVDVGLGYIGLGQAATTLSGGEAQRIKLATELSRRSTGRTLYLLDEPTTGLHFDDVAKLMKLLLQLRDQGNTIVVIEHNTDVMKCADWIIDLGPGGGDSGGNLVCEGTVPTIRACKESVTGRFL